MTGAESDGGATEEFTYNLCPYTAVSFTGTVGQANEIVSTTHPDDLSLLRIDQESIVKTTLVLQP